MAKMLYNDAPLTTGAIIKLLKSRGLTFKDETKASHLLDHISYFRFKSYLLPLLQNKQTGTFKSGATFEDAYTLYKFDSALRKLICAEMYMVLNSDAEFCILDEPFSNVAPKHVEMMQRLIQTHKATKGIIISDHMYEQVMDITDDLFLLRDGYTFPIKSREDLIHHGYILR